MKTAPQFGKKAKPSSTGPGEEKEVATPQVSHPATLREHAISDEMAQRNLVRSFVKNGQWGKVVELMNSGNPFAREAIERHDRKVRKAHKEETKRRTSSPHRKGKIDFSKLSGPAGAGQKGGGKEAPVIPEPGLSKGKRSRKTNFPGQGPAKGASG